MIIIGVAIVILFVLSIGLIFYISYIEKNKFKCYIDGTKISTKSDMIVVDENKNKIYVSENKTDWMEVASEEAGEKRRFKNDFAPTNARYEKIELEERTMEIYGYCMYEWQIFTVGSDEE